LNPTRPAQEVICDLFSLFAASVAERQALAEEVPSVREVSTDCMPESYQRLLAHPYHMTVALEQFYGRPVYLKVLRRYRAGSWYARKILLLLVGTEQVVEFGIMRIDLDACTPAVRRGIVAEEEPLGRLLIRHNIPRTIEPGPFLHIGLTPKLAQYFRVPHHGSTYARLARVASQGRPVVELLEMVAPMNESDRPREQTDPGGS